MNGLQRPVVLAAVAAALAVPAASVAGLASASSAPGRAGLISTAAGGVGGPASATNVAVRAPCGVSSGAGGLYIAGGRSVRVVDPGTGRLATPAGTGLGGPLGGGGLASRASLSRHTCGVAVDHSGNLVIADGGNNRVRVAAAASGTFYGRAMTAGHIYGVAGNGLRSSGGDGGPAVKAELNGPAAVAVDHSGNLVIADLYNNRVRVVAVKSGSFYGRAMTAGDIYTVAGDGTRGFSGDGGLATKAGLNDPAGVAVDAAGNLLIADSVSNRVRVVAVSGGTFYGRAMTAGDIYTVAGDGTGGFAGDGGAATKAELHDPAGVAVDAAGNLLIADTGSNRVRAVAAAGGTFYGRPMTAGHIYTVAGDGSPRFSGDRRPAAKAELRNPAGVAVDAAGNLLIADTFNNRVRVAAARNGTFYGQPMTAGHIYTVAGDGHKQGSSADGIPATEAAVHGPYGVTADAAGNLLIAETDGARVRVVAGSSGTFYGQPMTAGAIYTIAGDGIEGFSGDGGPATEAEFLLPYGVAVDAAGNVLVTDRFDCHVRVVAVKSGTFYGQPMTAGDVYSVAGNGGVGFSGDGGPATSAALDGPYGVVVDAAGNLVIGDSGNARVRVVAVKGGTFYGQPMTAGDIYTIAGDGTQGFSGDGGAATSAELNEPYGVAVDAAGNVLIAEHGSDRVRMVAATSGTFYGRAVTAGDIYTVAGDGIAGFSGNGGPATGAELNDPSGVAVNPAGNLLIADQANHQIRMVPG